MLVGVVVSACDKESGCVEVGVVDKILKKERGDGGIGRCGDNCPFHVVGM